MPKSTTPTKRKAGQGPRRGLEAAGRGSPTPAKRNSTSRKRAQVGTTSLTKHAYVVKDDHPEYVLVPVDEYEQLIKASMIENALPRLDDDETAWVEADELGRELAARRIAQARKAAGMTQKQLGDKLNLPQSQISRIERNPDRTTVRMLKRLAKALGVDIRALVG